MHNFCTMFVFFMTVSLSLFCSSDARVSKSPTINPSKRPSRIPTLYPSKIPTPPTRIPSSQPTGEPSSFPTLQPSTCPTSQPSAHPSGDPSTTPTTPPSSQPSGDPTAAPTAHPTTCAPTIMPSLQPVRRRRPTQTPIISVVPSFIATRFSNAPSTVPTNAPSIVPSISPSVSPSVFPSGKPSVSPTDAPSTSPSVLPSVMPSVMPSAKPSASPSNSPSRSSSGSPLRGSTLIPTLTNHPSDHPTPSPSTTIPSLILTRSSTSLRPSQIPATPSLAPSNARSNTPSTVPTNSSSIGQTGLNHNSSSSATLTGGDIAGIVIGSIGVILLGIFGARRYVLWQHKHPQKRKSNARNEESDETGNFPTIRREGDADSVEIPVDAMGPTLHTDRLTVSTGRAGLPIIPRLDIQGSVQPLSGSPIYDSSEESVSWSQRMLDFVSGLFALSGSVEDTSSNNWVTSDGSKQVTGTGLTASTNAFEDVSLRENTLSAIKQVPTAAVSAARISKKQELSVNEAESSRGSENGSDESVSAHMVEIPATNRTCEDTHSQIHSLLVSTARDSTARSLQGHSQSQSGVYSSDTKVIPSLLLYHSTGDRQMKSDRSNGGSDSSGSDRCGSVGDAYSAITESSAMPSVRVYSNSSSKRRPGIAPEADSGFFRAMLRLMDSLDEGASADSDSESDSDSDSSAESEELKAADKGKVSSNCRLVNIRKKVSTQRPQTGSSSILRSFSAPSVSFADKKT